MDPEYISLRAQFWSLSIEIDARANPSYNQKARSPYDVSTIKPASQEAELQPAASVDDVEDVVQISDQAYRLYRADLARKTAGKDASSSAAPKSNRQLESSSDSRDIVTQSTAPAPRTQTTELQNSVKRIWNRK